MKIIPASKACSLKGNQKVFYLQINQVASCCRAHSDAVDNTRTVDSYIEQWQQESQKLVDGIELAGCEVCWRDEDQGKISYRQQFSLFDTNTIELYISNLCNHMCSYCSPKYSSLWEESIQTRGVFRNVSSTAKNNLIVNQTSADIGYWLEQIQDYICTCDDNSVSLRLLGGEPLMQQRNLEKLLSLNSNKIKTLALHTNLNPPTNKFLIWILDNIDIAKLKITISLDATPDYNHIPRAGFEQTRFRSNLALLQDKNVNFNFNSVVSVLSIFDLENFITWQARNNFKIVFTKLNNPDCLDPKYIPSKFRQEIWQKIGHLNLDPIIIETLTQPDDLVDLKLVEQYNYLTQYFERSNIDPGRVNNALFVEYWAWLGNFVQERFKR
jgi:organic radical activating enzyme